jgi:hypothetical protein
MSNKILITITDEEMDAIEWAIEHCGYLASTGPEYRRDQHIRRALVLTQIKERFERDWIVEDGE